MVLNVFLFFCFVFMFLMLEKVGRVEKVEKVGEEVGESRRKFEKVPGKGRKA